MKHRITFYVFVVTALFLVAFSVPATEHPINLQTAQPSATNLPVITTVNVTHLKQVAQLGRGFIERLVWSPNNTSFAVCGSLGVWVYDIDNPQTPQLLESDTPCVSAVFNTNGTQLAFANEFNVYLWDVKTQTKRRLASDSQLFRPELAFEPSSPVLVIASGVALFAGEISKPI